MGLSTSTSGDMPKTLKLLDPSPLRGVVAIGVVAIGVVAVAVHGGKGVPRKRALSTEDIDISELSEAERARAPGTTSAWRQSEKLPRLRWRTTGVTSMDPPALGCREEAGVEPRLHSRPRSWVEAGVEAPEAAPRRESARPLRSGAPGVATWQAMGVAAGEGSVT